MDLSNYLPRVGDRWYTSDPPQNTQSQLASALAELPVVQDLEVLQKRIGNGRLKFLIKDKRRNALLPFVGETGKEDVMAILVESQHPVADTTTEITRMFKLGALSSALVHGMNDGETEEMVQLKRWLVRVWGNACIAMVYGELRQTLGGTTEISHSIHRQFVMACSTTLHSCLFPPAKDLFDFSSQLSSLSPVMKLWTTYMAGINTNPQTTGFRRTALVGQDTRGRVVCVFAPLWQGARFVDMEQDDTLSMIDLPHERTDASGTLAVQMGREIERMIFTERLLTPINPANGSVTVFTGGLYGQYQQPLPTVPLSYDQGMIADSASKLVQYVL